MLLQHSMHSRPRRQHRALLTQQRLYIPPSAAASLDVSFLFRWIENAQKHGCSCIDHVFNKPLPISSVAIGKGRSFPLTAQNSPPSRAGTEHNPYGCCKVSLSLLSDVRLRSSVSNLRELSKKSREGISAFTFVQTTAETQCSYHLPVTLLIYFHREFAHQQ